MANKVFNFGPNPQYDKNSLKISYKDISMISKPSYKFQKKMQLKKKKEVAHALSRTKYRKVRRIPKYPSVQNFSSDANAKSSS